jgi:hypothetical protein
MKPSCVNGLERARGPALPKLVQNVAGLAKKNLPASFDEHELVKLGENGITVRHNDDDGPFLPQSSDRLCKCFVAASIHTCVWLVENNEERNTVNGTREPNSLAFAAGKRLAARTDDCIEPLGKSNNQLVHVREICSLEHVGG